MVRNKTWQRLNVPIGRSICGRRPSCPRCLCPWGIFWPRRRWGDLRRPGRALFQRRRADGDWNADFVRSARTRSEKRRLQQAHNYNFLWCYQNQVGKATALKSERQTHGQAQWPLFMRLFTMNKRIQRYPYFIFFLNKQLFIIVVVIMFRYFFRF